MRKLFTILLAGAAMLATSCKDEDPPVPTYGITVSDDGNGTAEATVGDAKVNSAVEGVTITVTATAAEEYKFTRWTVLGGDVSLNDATANPATFTMPAAAVEIKAEFEAIQRTVTMTTDGNGTAEADPADAANGQTVTITATANDNYEFKQWTVVSGGVTLSDATANPATFTMLSEEVEIIAEFVAIERTVTMTNDGNGTAVADPANAPLDQTVTLTATPAEGFDFKQWVVVSGDVTLSDATANPATFSMPASAVEIRAEFQAAKIRYKVGDYWPDPNAVYNGGVLQSGEAAQGVVFWLDTAHSDYNADDKTGTSGKVLHLKNSAADNIMWATQAGVTNANNQDDGQANMEIIKGLDDWETKYPAFKTCADLGQGWYLPARNEMQFVYCAYNGQPYETWTGQSSVAANDTARTEFDTLLTAAGGDAMLGALPMPYWTSSEATGNTAIDSAYVLIIFFKEAGTEYKYHYNYSTGAYVRAIRTIE